jgi:arylsulfatase A-like enzyme
VSATAASPPTAPKRRPNVLVLSLDALRADHLESGGHDPEVMPTLNALAKRSATYTNFRSLSSFTSQTIGGFLGCRYPSELKRSGSFFGVYPPEELLFPELLQKAGVKTMSGHAHFYFGKAGFDQGFDVYEMVPGIKKNNTTDESVTSPAHTEMILQHLTKAGSSDQPFFAWYHLMDAHDVYKEHKENKSFGKGQRGLYDGELHFVDQHLAKIFALVESAPWGKDTLIVVTSDHGEAFGEHKMTRHGFELWDVLTRVPLIVHGPGVKARTIGKLRSMIDLCPTILESFGAPADPSFHGQSLWSELRGEDLPDRDVITDLARSSDNDRRRTFQRGTFKVIELGDGDGFQLFDLATDPGEESDLARKQKDKLAELRSAMTEALKPVKEVCPKKTTNLKGKKDNKPSAVSAARRRSGRPRRA